MNAEEKAAAYQQYLEKEEEIQSSTQAKTEEGHRQ